MRVARVVCYVCVLGVWCVWVCGAVCAYAVCGVRVLSASYVF